MPNQDNYFAAENLDAAGYVGSNGSAAAGAGTIGEVLTTTVASGAAVSLTTATAKSIMTVVLTPGDYDIWGCVNFNPAASTSITSLIASLSLTADTLSTQPGGSGLGTDPNDQWSQAAAVNNGVITMYPLTTLRVYAATTLQLVAKATFTVSTMTAYGSVFARRRA